MQWFIYILQCADGTFYTGITNNLEARLKQHNAGQGARYTTSRRPVRLAYTETAVNRSQALKREYALKQLSRVGKEAIIKARSSET